MTDDGASRAPAELIGWRSAVSMLQMGLGRGSVERGVKVELDISEEAAHAAVDFAVAWLEAAHQR